MTQAPDAVDVNLDTLEVRLDALEVKLEALKVDSDALEVDPDTLYLVHIHTKTIKTKTAVRIQAIDLDIHHSRARVQGEQSGRTSKCTEVRKSPQLDQNTTVSYISRDTEENEKCK